MNNIETPMISFWRGKRVDEMTREELIEAVQWLGARHDEATSPQPIGTRILCRSGLAKHD